jgi:indolepyruvate ferredoxin oxidoreductase beta subunit
MNASDDRSDGTGWRILIAGTGGQGVMTAARLLSETFVELGHDVVSGQLHGMAQRGGSVQSSVIINGGISPVIASGRADVVLGFEPVETARALPLMSYRTVVYMNTAPVVPFILGQRYILKKDDAEYPDVKGLIDRVSEATPRVCAFDATEIAVETGSAKAVNIVMLGCLLGSGVLPCLADVFWDIVARKIPPRLADVNAMAFSRGVDVGGRLQTLEGAR